MKLLIFGATGMLGQGLLRECLAAADVSQVTTLGRTPTGIAHPKLRELIAPDLFSLSDDLLRGPFDACFFVIGVSSAGLDEAAYTRLTFDLTLAVATPLARLNHDLTFIYGSGAGADSSEKTSRTMWARVRGRTENALFKLPFKCVCAIRPGLIQPLHGARSKTTSYRVFYNLFAPLLPLARWLAPRSILSTEIIAQAMLNIARRGTSQTVLESDDIWVAAQ